MVVGSWKLLTDELNEREQAIVVMFMFFFGVGALSRNGDGGRGEREVVDFS